VGPEWSSRQVGRNEGYLQSDLVLRLPDVLK